MCVGREYWKKAAFLICGSVDRSASRPGSDNREELLICLVGAEGFEPSTSWSRTRRSTRLSHAPTRPFLSYYSTSGWFGQVCRPDALLENHHDPGKHTQIFGVKPYPLEYEIS